MARNKNFSTKKKMKVVGRQKFANTSTGEIEEFNVIQINDSDANFDKIWMAHLLDALDMIGGQKIKVLTYLLENKNKDNIVIASQQAIATAIGTSIQTVSFTLRALKEADFLTSNQYGVYRLNPDVIFKGYNSTRMNVLIQYNKEAAAAKEQEPRRTRKKAQAAEDPLEQIPGQISLTGDDREVASL